MPLASLPKATEKTPQTDPGHPCKKVGAKKRSTQSGRPLKGEIRRRIPTNKCHKFSEWHFVSPCGETLSYKISFNKSNFRLYKKAFRRFNLSIARESIIHQHQEQVVGSNNPIAVEITGA